MRDSISVFTINTEISHIFSPIFIIQGVAEETVIFGKSLVVIGAKMLSKKIN